MFFVKFKEHRRITLIQSALAPLQCKALMGERLPLVPQLKLWRHADGLPKGILVIPQAHGSGTKISL
jgi:hypothetical protein